MPKNKKDNPSVPGVVHERQQKALTIVDDVYEGTLRLRKKRAVYLPQFPREPDDAYKDRAETSVLYNAFRRTVQGLVGMVFRNDPELDDDVPEDLLSHAENIDQAGRALEVFARDVFEHGLRDGHSHIFVDFQRIEGQFDNALEEERAGVRPYWVHIDKADVLSFRAERVQGEHILTQFVYRERVVRPDGDYAEQEVTRYRVYKLVRAASSEGIEREEGTAVAFEVFRRTDEKAHGAAESDDLQKVDEGVMDIGRIPLTTFYAARKGFMESDPPMLDLALENIKHFQVRSDRDTGIHVTNNPTPVFVGLEPDEITVGSNNGIAIPNPEGSANYLEASGTGLESARQELQDIETRMAALGLAMLQRETRAAETAEARRIEKSETDSNLATAARSLQDALIEALGFHAEWLGKEEAGTVSVNRDFEAQMLSPQMVQALVAMVDRQKLSLETMWEILERGEVLPEGFDREQEMDRLQAGGMDLLASATGPSPVPEDDGGEGGEEAA